MNLKKLLLTKQKGDLTLAIIFLVIGLSLAVVGYVRNDFLWYIRTLIFCIAAWFMYSRSKD